MSISLREAFDSVPKRRSGGKCYTCVALETMPVEDAETLRELLDSDATSTVIAQACQKAGYSRLSERSIGRHRKGSCFPLSY